MMSPLDVRNGDNENISISGERVGRMRPVWGVVGTAGFAEKLVTPCPSCTVPGPLMDGLRPRQRPPYSQEGILVETF